MSGETLVKLVRIRRGYGRRNTGADVLRGVDLEVAAGEMVSITGRSGAGKTTLLHLIAGLDRPTSGSVWVAGKDLARLSDRALARHRALTIGVVFQAFNLLDHLSVGENVMLPAVFRHDGRGVARARALEALERVGLADRVDALPGRLSGGEQQRVALARAIFARLAVLICDEVTGNLDGQTGAEVVALIDSVRREQGTAVVVATHDENLVRASNRVLNLEGGRLEPATNGVTP